ncbi:ferredoxin [Herbiconiux sp. KACC 21604]|uniref:ferredoxin n=1 Tax=unclassified Herbiconiux TaxID=2618217 RepID=UPI001491B83D|nr:ferredoxin [Herbiconiux sp. SALV-R1]QJU53472.1 ferredoxin [Herbiconiux sp. SALV-R1]WPO88444.1 ferredoxin [Herbiconiux sp. KACC 21604]
MTRAEATSPALSRRRPAATLHIDWTRCQARGACLELLPALLRADDDGYPLAAAPAGARTDVPVPPEEMPAARDAVALCPRLALTLRGDR